MSRTLARPSLKPQPVISPPAMLPPLICAIFRDGKLDGLAEQPDPRDQFCWSYNSQGRAFGLSARPLDSEEVAIARKLLAERTVDHV